MNAITMTSVLLLGLLGQDAPEESPPPEVLRVLTIHATLEGRPVADFDPSLAPLESYLEDLPYDTYRELNFDEVEAEYVVATPAAINDRYSLYCIPRGVSEEGEVLFDAYIEMQESGESVEALRVSGKASRGQGIVFRGLGMPSGELIVVFSIAKAAEESGGAGQGQGEGDDTGEGSPRDSDGEQGGGEDGDGDGDADSEDPLSLPERPEAQEDERTSENPGDPEQANESPLPPDLANVEGILRKLEDQDLREQQNARNRRYDVIIRGDWW